MMGPTSHLVSIYQHKYSKQTQYAVGSIELMCSFQFALSISHNTNVVRTEQTMTEQNAENNNLWSLRL